MVCRYERIGQKPDLCGCACIEMILRRRNINDYNQEQIAIETGTLVLEKNIHEYGLQLPTTKDVREAGLLDMEKLNSFLKRHELQAEYIPIKNNLGNILDEFKKDENLRDDTDVIANYWRRKQKRGHYVLLEHPLSRTSIVCDPASKTDIMHAIDYDVFEMFMDQTQSDGKQRGIIVVKSLNPFSHKVNFSF